MLQSRSARSAPRRAATLLGLAATAALCAPATASADAPWGPVADAGPLATGYVRPALDVARDGTGAYGASVPDPRFPRLPGIGQLGRLAVGGAPGALRDRSDDLAAGPDAYATASFAILTTKRSSSSTDTFRPRVDVRAAFGSTRDGRTGEARTLARGLVLAGRPVLAVNDRGEAAAAWIEDRSDVSDRLWLALRRPGQAFATPTVLLGKGNLSGVDVAFGEGGDLVVAAVRNVDGRARIVARVRRAGHGFGEVQDLGPNRGIATVRAAMAPTGRAVVAWGTQDGGIEANVPYRVYAAVKPAGPRSFRDATLLDEAPIAAYPAGPPQLGIARDGTATVAWSMPVRVQAGSRELAFPVRTATTGTDAVFRAPLDSGATGAVRDVAVNVDGATAVTVARLDLQGPAGDAAVALVRPPGAALFGPPETIAAESVGADGPAVTFDPQGRVLALWSRTTGEDQQLRIAVRPPAVSG